MGEIRPFRALRFSPGAGELGGLLAPASDALTADERAGLAENPNNVIHASGPVGSKDDRSKYVRYARASAQLSGWRRAGILVADAEPAMYRVDDADNQGEVAEWISLVPLAAIQKEQSPVAPKERDQALRMLEATRVHLEPVRLLVKPWEGYARFFAALSQLHLEPSTELAQWGAGERRLSAVSGERVSSLVATSDGIIFQVIADAARVEAARTFRATLGDREGPVAADYILAVICSAKPLPSGLVMWNLGDWP